MRFATQRLPDALGLTLLTDAGAAAVMELGATGSLTLSMAVHIRGLASSEWVACRATSRFVGGGYHEEGVELWDRRGWLLAQAQKLAIWQ
jgi:hypothetical protein